ncbi:hypothetical protein EBU02_13595 [bacterium]|nr:hypothetical protein [bacterium]
MMSHSMHSLLRFLFIVSAVLTGSVLPASAEERTSNLYWAPPNNTVGGEKIDMLLNFIFGLTLLVFVATQAVYIIYLIRYRRRAGHKAHYSHGNNTLEFWWTIIPTAIFLLSPLTLSHWISWATNSDGTFATRVPMANSVRVMSKNSVSKISLALIPQMLLAKTTSLRPS